MKDSGQSQGIVLAGIVLALIGGCAGPSEDSRTGGGLSAGGTLPTSSSSSSTMTTGETTGDTTASTTDMTTGGVVTMTDSTTTTGDGTTTSDSGDAPSCWGASPVAWTVTEIDVEALVGANPAQVMVSSDGLTLTYVAGPEDNRRPYRTVRASRDDPFEGGTIEAVWEGIEGAIGYPRTLPDRSEMFITLGADLGVSLYDGAVWALPELLGAPVSTGAVEGHYSLMADGSRLLVQRQDGPVNEQLGETWRFYEFKRAADAAPGSNFSTYGIADLPGITDDDYAHVTLCPTLSPDGHHLFFGSSYPTVLGENNLADALNVFYTSRDDLDAGWEMPVAISTFHESGLETCPSAVTADGCVLLFHRFELGMSGSSHYVATREAE